MRLAFDDAVASVEEEVRKACEGTDGGGRKMLSDLRNASQRVRDNSHAIIASFDKGRDDWLGCLFQDSE